MGCAPYDVVMFSATRETHQVVVPANCGCMGAEMWKGVYVPPFSMPLTAAPEIVLSTALAASLMVSTGLLRATGVVLNRRAWRAIC